MHLRREISTPDGKRRYVRRLFGTIADRYDLITVLLSCGQDRRWKRRLAGLSGAGAGVRALDLATGTGDIAFRLAEGGADVVGLDVTYRMIELARAKRPAWAARGGGASGEARIEPPAFLVGDMLALPFPSGSFDVVTVGYGLRNVPNLDHALAEIRRVLKAGGRALSLDFNRPSNAVVRAVYLGYLSMIGGTLGWILHRDADTYRYIPASIQNYPGADGVSRLLDAHGFVRVAHYPVLGGLMTIHSARKP